MLMDSKKKNYWYVPLKEQYGDFIAGERSGGTVNGYYRLKTNKSGEGFDVIVQIFFGESVEQMHDAMRDTVKSYSSGVAHLSIREGIAVGDFSLGNKNRISFIRGNVAVDVMGDMFGNDISVVGLAKEIDSQILRVVSNGQKIPEAASLAQFKDLNLYAMKSEENINLVLSHLPQAYPRNCYYVPLEKGYKDLIYVQSYESQHPVVIDGYYNLAGDRDRMEEDFEYDIRVTLTPFKTSKEAKNMMTEHLNYSWPTFHEPLTARKRNIGDWSMENKERRNFFFIRGNVLVEIRWFFDDVPFVDLAEEIDKHIQAVITGSSEAWLQP